MSMELTEDELAEYVGKRVLNDAEVLARFIGKDFTARFPLEWLGRKFWITTSLENET